MSRASSQLPLVQEAGARPFYSARAYSSLLKGWRTPPALFLAACRYVAGQPPTVHEADVLRPWVDPCATASSALVPRFFSPEEDGLAQSWQPPPGLPSFVFSNPPYGNPEEACTRACRKKVCVKRGHHLAERLPGVEDWVVKSRQEALAGAFTTVNLLPYRAGAAWFADALLPPESAGAWVGGESLPGHLARFSDYWPCTSWTRYRWRHLEVEVGVLRGRLHYLEEDSGEDAGPAGFDSCLLTFRGLGR